MQEKKAIFVVIHKAKNVPKVNANIYFECSLNNEHLKTELFVPTNEMTIEVELVFYLTEEQYDFLLKSNLKCKVSCFQHPRKLLGFFFLDLHQAESHLPPVKRKWMSWNNAGFPKPQTLIGFGSGALPDTAQAPDSLEEAISNWTPVTTLETHNGAIVVDKDQHHSRITLSISTQLQQDHTIGVSILNKAILLSPDTPKKAVQYTFEGSVKALHAFLQQQTAHIYLIHNATKVAQESTTLFDILSKPTTLSIAYSSITFACHDLPTFTPKPILKPSSIPTIPHHYRVSIDIKSFLPSTTLKVPIALSYHILLNAPHHFMTRPPVHTQSGISSFFENGFSAYAFHGQVTLLQDLTVSILGVQDQMETLGTIIVPLQRVLEAPIQDDIQLIDLKLSHDLGTVHISVALEDFGEQLGNRDMGTMTSQSLHSQWVQTEQVELPMDKLFQGYKEIEYQLSELEQIRKDMKKNKPVPVKTPVTPPVSKPDPRIKALETKLQEVQAQHKEDIIRMRPQKASPIEIDALQVKLQKSEQAKMFYKRELAKAQQQLQEMKEQQFREQQEQLQLDNKVVQQMKWQYLIQQEQKKNKEELRMLNDIKKELHPTPQKDRLLQEKKALMKTGLYAENDPVIAYINKHL